MIKRVEKVTVYVNSQEDAKQFWKDKMGFDVTFEQQMGPNMKWIEVSPKGDVLTTLVLYSKAAMQEQNPDAVAHPGIIFAADDIDNLWKQIKDNGVEVSQIQNMPYGKMFNFSDNDGNPYLVRG